jgi:hypothetical protein
MLNQKAMSDLVQSGQLAEKSETGITFVKEISKARQRHMDQMHQNASVMIQIHIFLYALD